MNCSFGCTSAIIMDHFVARIIFFFNTRQRSHRKCSAMLRPIILLRSMNSIKMAFAALSTPLTGSSYQYMFHFTDFCKKKTFNIERNFQTNIALRHVSRPCMDCLAFKSICNALKYQCIRNKGYSLG